MIWLSVNMRHMPTAATLRSLGGILGVCVMMKFVNKFDHNLTFVSGQPYYKVNQVNKTHCG